MLKRALQAPRKCLGCYSLQTARPPEEQAMRYRFHKRFTIRVKSVRYLDVVIEAATQREALLRATDAASQVAAESCEAYQCARLASTVVSRCPVAITFEPTPRLPMVPDEGVRLRHYFVRVEFCRSCERARSEGHLLGRSSARSGCLFRTGSHTRLPRPWNSSTRSFQTNRPPSDERPEEESQHGRRSEHLPHSPDPSIPPSTNVNGVSSPLPSNEAVLRSEIPGMPGLAKAPD
jgi:hypothetical protein